MNTVNTETLIETINTNMNSSEPIDNAVLDLMLQNIGNTDSYLRDDVIYNSWTVLFDTKKLTTKQKVKLLRHIIDNKTLFTNIDTPFNDATFERAFSSLLLVQLLEDHYKESWIPAYTESHLVDVVLNYMMQEKDNRGLTEQGWAHAFAHGADLMGAIAKSKLFSRRDYKRFLECLEYALVDVENFYYGEEGRLAKALVSFMENQTNFENEIDAWIQTVSTKLISSKTYNVCWKNFLMSLYFSLKANQIDSSKVLSTIEASLINFYNEFKVL